MRLTDKQRHTLMSALNSSGIFISCGIEQPNVMSTHWGGLGNYWNRSVFTLPVRMSKFSHDIINATKSFAISVPLKDMRNEIVKCDHMSGFFVNKFEELHLHPKRARHIPAYVLAECGFFLECKVLFAADMARDQIDPDLRNEMYACKDFHTLYFGEIIDAYTLDENFSL